ncbi:hypothetical protein LRAMOSA09818 [Lichtheimia ramosa]|uniref:NEDD8-activating enzyme E1 regulatory subunit n=1 Tax=Lichtheimia ramosa TaxID=688394 RepID=A0A077WL86_9FUNG|nr:hypothetical protein LRAMOSA09818 [Lichtheimia ramosa]
MSAIAAVPINDLKTQKYDRQLRLWASTGQTALENAKICLLNATATGCEVLKNLVLPGVGNVTVIDDAIVNDTDLRCNFFLEPSSIGRSRAECTAALLAELNEDASVTSLHKSPTDLVHNEPEFFDNFTMIIATNLHEKDMLALSDICDHSKTTLIAVSSKGLCGVFRIQAPEHPVIDTHPENAIDLRLGCPFNELLDYVDTIDLDQLDQTDHGHVPFVVILLKYVKEWKLQHDNQPPASYSERNQLKENIRKGMRTVDEENFEEALANVWRLASTSTITSNVRTIFEDQNCENLSAQSNAFWIVARAIKEFVANEGQGQLPLSGKLPDMKSDTPRYMALQNIYRQKALSDLDAVKSRVRNLLREIDMPEDTVPDKMIEDFCKNAAHIQLLRYRTLRDEYVTAPSKETIANTIQMDENLYYYLIFRAAERYFDKHGRYPGAQCGTNSTDVDLLEHETKSLMEELGLAIDESDSFRKAVNNFVRFADQETSNIAALMGGLIAQEAIKMITAQYIPINNTCIFNGIASTSSVCQL